MTDDEYTCLLIMKDGENLIRMKDTRWYAALTLLDQKDFARCVGNENYVITKRGLAALAGHEETLNADLRKTIALSGQVTAARKAVHGKMLEAKDALLAAAKISAGATGRPERDCFFSMIEEVRQRGAGEIGGERDALLAAQEQLR